ncbi:MAG: hypothetical protein JNM59_06760 [Hyphomonadaceae bacterium]|nr:hypothetical protein [Hyphomonadaceae bacterium]
MHAAHTPEHSSVASLWHTFAEFVRASLAMFGDPQALIDVLLMERKAHRLACQWIARCEHLLRRLLFIDAAALVMRADARADVAPARNNANRVARDGGASKGRASVQLALRLDRARGSTAARTRRPRGAKELASSVIDPDRSAASAAALADIYRDLFANDPPAEKRVAPPCAADREGRAWTAYVSTHGLARRLEALTRAERDREKLAKRLACWLARRRALARLFTRPTRTFFSLQRQAGDFAVADAAHFAHAAWSAVDSS